MTWVLSLVVAVAGCLAQEPQRPQCNAAHRGQVWPEAKDRDACHPIELCTLDVWRYRWKPLTVSAIRKRSKRGTSCTPPAPK